MLPVHRLVWREPALFAESSATVEPPVRRGPSRAGAIAAAHLGRLGQADVIAIVLIAVQVGWRAVLVSGGVLRQDDFLLAATAHRRGLSVVFDDYHGHIQLIGWIVAWLADRTAPMQHWPLAVIVTVLQAASSVLAWLAIRSLVGPRRVALLGLAVVLFSPLTIGPLMWVAAAVQMLTLQIAIFAAVIAHSRAKQAGTSSAVVVAWVVLGLGLLANEKALVVPLVLLGLFLVKSPSRLLDSLRVDRTLWMGYGALVVGEVILYLSVARSNNFEPVNSISPLVRDGFAGIWLPQISAVPIHGAVWPPLLRPPPVAATVVAAVCAVAVIVFALTRTGVRAVRAFALLALYVAADYTVTALSRLGFGFLVAIDPRYVADTVPVAGMCLALAVTRQPGDRPWRIGRTATSRRIRPFVALAAICAAVAAYAVAAVPVTAATADSGRRAGNAAYVDRVRHALSGRNLTLVDGSVPDDVISGLFGAESRLSDLVSVLPGSRRFAGVTSQPYLVDLTGRLRPAAPGPGSVRVTGPEPDCGWGAEAGAPVTIPLESPLSGGPGIVSIGYVVGAPTPVRFVLGQRAISMTLRGLGHVLVVVDAAAGPITVTGVRPGVRLCISDVTVGPAAPK
jgi:hypothetical protein